MSDVSVVRASSSNLSENEIERLYQIMVHAYAITEIDIWGKDYVRCNREEFSSSIAQGLMFVARIENVVVGSIRVQKETDELYSFGLLSADFKQKGSGIGRSLVQAAENYGREQGAKKMSLEILRPANFEVPFKTILHQWYSGMGYQLLTTLDFLERKPTRTDKAKLMVNPSVFDYYEKEL